MAKPALYPIDQTASTPTEPPSDLRHKISSYYDIATPGYQDWSRNINMHFGLYRRGNKLFDREAMLENTNAAVLQRVTGGRRVEHLLDLGCGIGATARFAVKRGYAHKVCGISLSANQVEQAIDFSHAEGLEEQTSFARMDFHNTPMRSATFDGAYAIESACHSPQVDKRALLAEAYRLLKPGGRLVLCDAFLKNPEDMNAFSKWAHQKICQNWALGGFGDVERVHNRLQALGFIDIRIENVTLSILPSALSVPWVSLKYFCKLIVRRETDARYWRHLFAPLWGLLLAANVKHFGYYLISASKPGLD